MRKYAQEKIEHKTSDTDKNTILEKVEKLFNELVIYFIDKDGNRLKASISPLERLGPLHSSAKYRIYVEFMSEGGDSIFLILGVITKKMNPHFVQGLSLVAEFESDEEKLQVWINDDLINRIDVHIPSGSEQIWYDVAKSDDENDDELLLPF